MSPAFPRLRGRGRMRRMKGDPIILLVRRLARSRTLWWFCSSQPRAMMHSSASSAPPRLRADVPLRAAFPTLPSALQSRLIAWR